MGRGESSNPPPKRRGPQKLADVIPELMARRGYARLLSHDEFQEVWQQASGALSEHSRVGQLRRGVMEIIVNSSLIKQELMFEKRRLLQHVTEHLPHQKIRDLRFTVGVID